MELVMGINVHNDQAMKRAVGEDIRQHIIRICLKGEADHGKAGICLGQFLRKAGYDFSPEYAWFRAGDHQGNVKGQAGGVSLKGEG